MSKRIFDVFFSVLGLLLLTPLFLLIAIWIKVDSPGPVFFRQERIGRYGVPFRLHKFRTMKVDAEKEGRLTIGQDKRVTGSGSFLRKSKLDELPQLIDVLIGKMSLVGPRPEVQEYIQCYPADVRQEVLSVRPGITDRASIEMVDENEILGQYDDPQQAYIDVILPLKQRYYVEYVRTHSVASDIGIIFSTLFKILNRSR